MNMRTATLLLTLATPLMAAEPAVHGPTERGPTVRGPIWIDVRSVEEYQQDHLPGAVLIPYTHIARGVTERFPNRNTPINLYGEDGHRSRMAMEALQTLGYSRVENFGSLNSIRGNEPAPALLPQPAGHTMPSE